MNAMLRVALLAPLAVALLVLPAAGQGVPNLSGTWTMVPERSDFGEMPAPINRTDVIAHDEPALTVQRTQMTPNGEVTTTLVYAVDGKPHTNMAGPSEVSSTLHWEDRVLVVVSTVEAQGATVTITDRYRLSEDGTTLTQSRTISVQGQELTQTIVLARAD